MAAAFPMTLAGALRVVVFLVSCLLSLVSWYCGRLGLLGLSSVVSETTSIPDLCGIYGTHRILDDRLGHSHSDTVDCLAAILGIIFALIGPIREW